MFGVPNGIKLKSSVLETFPGRSYNVLVHIHDILGDSKFVTNVTLL